jgi:beta-glucanase (GH16 family)
MRTNLMLVLAGLLMPALGDGSPLIPPPPTLPSEYRLVFEDHFEGSTLSPAKWNTTMAFAGRQGGRYHNTSYLHYVLDDDVTLADGTLQLRAAKRAVEGDDPPGRYDYSAGLVTTHDKFAFQYGYFEMRAKYPGGPGVWPAFWLIGQGQYWPPEFDIAEYYGGRGVMHYGLCHGTLKNVQWDSTGDGDADRKVETGWHTFALDWRPGKATWLVDGVVKKTVVAEYVPDIPMYLIISNGVGSRFGPSGVPTEETVFPNFFQIDYVRVYQSPGAKRIEERKAPLFPPIIATPGP